jgi:DNA repair protein RecO (recombination protein O)
MFFKYRTQGLIFKKEERGEADQLFKVFTKDFGKLEVLGKAIRKISSKLRSGIEIFYLSEIEFIQGKIYKTLTDAFLIEKFQNLRKDLERLDIAYKISEVLDNLVKGQEPDENLWNLLNETFQKLNTCNLKPITYNLIYYYFFWNFISILGYKPELYFCPICQKKLKPEKLYFSSKEGGIICQDCSKKFKDKIEIKPEVVKILRKILEKDWKILSRLRNTEEYLRALEIISKDYSSFICRVAWQRGERRSDSFFELEKRNDKI